MVFLVRGRGAEKIEGRRKQTIKTLKNEESEKRRIQGKLNNNNKHLWFYFLYKKLYFVRKHSLKKKTVYTVTFYLQFLCATGYLKRNNDTKLNIHKYTNYNTIEIYMNRLSTTTQIFIAMDYLILML